MYSIWRLFGKPLEDEAMFYEADHHSFIAIRILSLRQGKLAPQEEP
jgi:hypothetical protein